MALDFSKFNFFNRLDARARIFFLIAGIVGVILIIYFITRLFSGGTSTTGPSRVASAPQGLQSVPGGQLTPEYYRALQQANVQAAQQAQISGGSAVPTLVNIGDQGAQPGAPCVICSDDSANVKYNLDDWVRQGKLAPEIANGLQQLADKNVSIDEYAAELDRLVREGKLTPEQARALLEQYKKQHTNALLQDSAKQMDGMIKNGQLPLDAANDLLLAQKDKVSPSDYASQLQELVRQGKLSPTAAQQLLAQYSQQRAKEIVMKSVTSLHKMARDGQITPEVENELVGLEFNMVPVDVYSSTLQRLIGGGKITPAVANKILEEFKWQKSAIGPLESVNQLLQKAEAAAYGEINDLMKEGKMPADVGAMLTDMIQRDVPFDQYQAVINQLVQQKKITPEIGKLKIADYQEVRRLRDLSSRLGGLQGNNASAAAYADELKRAVQQGALTPEQAARLLQEYQAMTAAAPTALPTTATPGTEDFLKLQQRVQQGAPTAPAGMSAEEFAAAQARALQESSQERQARVEAMATAMASQAQQLITSWQPPVMASRVGSVEDTMAKAKEDAAAKAAAANAAAAAGDQALGGAPLIKAGTILFAVLDTAVNSDYPDSPVMATIVDGKYKGAKLLGKLVTAKSVSGQLDRISLNFTMMNMDEWAKSKSVTSYAIDPDTARTVMASSVDYHYMQRFGAMMATSFLQGYASAIKNEGTSTTGIFGTSTSTPELSPGNKIAVGLGQIGQTLGAATQNYINIAPTVKVDSGVGLGILFMSDVT